MKGIITPHMANLVIVESPAKAATIKGYLGSNYKVIASKGHIRDLPKSSMGVDIEHGFEPRYINIRGKGDVIAQLKKEAKNATKVYLATDPDREGEAISWHLAYTLGIPADKACRITFNEITKTAVKEAVKHPRAIDMGLVNSQQARRILDRIVGYELSPFLWKNVKSGLSAGRVQSVATRAICEREEEIRAFCPREYWTLNCILQTQNGERLAAQYSMRPATESEANEVLIKTENGVFRVKTVKTAQKKRQPAPPFITSTLQQEASKKLGFQPQHTMRIAQELYEGVSLGHELGGVQGLITYMRTDSTRIADSASSAARAYITAEYGKAYVPEKPNTFRTKNNIQDAHEAIRPSDMTLTPEVVKGKLTPDQYRLYRLIWERFLASQMTPVVYDTTTIEADCSGYVFRIGGYTVKSRGYSIIYDNHDKEEIEADGSLSAGKLPPVKVGDILTSTEMTADRHETEPPSRYNDATIIRYLEESGIGRPSTYTTIITTIIGRAYVKRVGKNLVPTKLGEVTTRLMKDSFPEIVDDRFTAQLEGKLDSIEQGDATMQGVLTDFYGEFEKMLAKAKSTVKPENVPMEESNVICEKCGSKMVYKTGKFGRFLACPNFPACRNTIAVDKDGNPQEKKPPEAPKKAGFVCEECGADMVIRQGRYGEFYACSNYPTCKFTKQMIKEIGVPCPKCGAKVVVRRSRDRKVFYSCERYPDCDYSTWDMPVAEKCPTCGGTLVYKKSKKRVVCTSPDCEYSREAEMKVIE